MKRSHRRNRNPHVQEKTEEPFFGAKTGSKTGETSPFFQAKGLTIGQPGDKYEQEADAMADAVVNNRNTPAIQEKGISSIQRESLATPLEDERLGTAEQRMEEDKLVQEKPDLQAMGEEAREEEEMLVQEMHEEEEEGELQTKSEGSNATMASPSITGQIKNSSGRGRPLSGKVRTEMESSFGASFRDVNIHTDQNSIDMNKRLKAQAFTHGKDIYFNSGKFNPETSAGRRLLAHELTHVIQQQGGQDGMLSMDREGGTSPQSGVNEEQVSCPDAERLDEIEENYRSMIRSAREDGYNVAADNLEHFLAGSGAKRTLSVAWLRGFSAVTDAEERNQGRFESSLEDLADGMTHGQSRTFDDYWDAQLTASVFEELYYASGTSTIRSTGHFTLERIEDIVNIHGTVEHRWHDPYDWHAGLGAFIPGHGNVSDEDGLLMQSCRGAKPFQMEALWTQRLSGSVNINDYWFNSSSFSWTGP